MSLLLVLLIVSLSFILYKWLTRDFDIFKNCGIPFVKPLSILGSNYGLYFGSYSAYDFIKIMYDKFPREDVVGLFDFTNPTFLIRSPELLKKIAIKDFNYFQDRRFSLDVVSDDVSMANLVMLHGEKWHNMRGALSPIFTGSKMRLMYPLLTEIASQMSIYLKQNKGERVFEMKNIFSRYSNDVIASSAFGFKVDSLNEKNNQVFVMGKELISFSDFVSQLRIGLFFLVPNLMCRLKISLFAPRPQRFFENLFGEAIKLRENQGENQNERRRNDMIDLLLDLKKGSLKSSDSLDDKNRNEFDSTGTFEISKSSKNNWTDNELLGQCLVFYFAGFDTTSTALSFLAYELALNKGVQDKLTSEIDETNRKLRGGHLTYETLQRMKYLDMVVLEALRKWSPAPFTDRKCVKDYVVELNDGAKFSIKKGSLIWVPIHAIHHDPKVYPNPEIFDPERFGDENKANIAPGTFLPFGYGPRSCIGNRFALMNIKTAIYYILRDFTFEVTEKTQVPLTFKKGLDVRPEKGVWIELKERTNKL